MTHTHTPSRLPAIAKSLTMEIANDRLKLTKIEKENATLKSAILAALENVTFMGDAKYSKNLFDLIK
jgi:hypothetical protein